MADPLNHLSPIKIAFWLYPNVTQLDLTGPAQVLSRLGNARIELVAKTMSPVMTDAGFCLTPTKLYADGTKYDIVCVPGGFGTQDAMEDDDGLDWLHRTASQAQWVTSVCTGSLLLGMAGLLKGYRATSHWASHHLLKEFGAIPVKERVVFDRNRVTGGGVTAGIDFGFELVKAIRGEEHARLVQLSLEYDPKPPFPCGSPDCASPETMERYRALVAKAAPNREDRTRAAAKRMLG